MGYLIAILLLILPWFIVIVLVVTIVTVSYNAKKEKSNLERTIELLKKKSDASIVMDSERIKILYRMDCLDRFVRKNFQSVKDWKVVGDDSMHCAFFTANIKKSNFKYVIIYFLDGTEEEVKIDISKFMEIETASLSFYISPMPNDQRNIEKRETLRNEWKLYKESLPDWNTVSNQAVLKMYDQNICAVRFGEKVLKLFLDSGGITDELIRENNIKVKERFRRFEDMIFEDIRIQEKRAFEAGQYSGVFLHDIKDMKIPENFGEYPNIWLRKDNLPQLHYLIDKNSIVVRDDKIKYTVKIPLNKEFWNKV